MKYDPYTPRDSSEKGNKILLHGSAKSDPNNIAPCEISQIENKEKYYLVPLQKVLKMFKFIQRERKLWLPKNGEREEVVTLWEKNFSV